MPVGVPQQPVEGVWEYSYFYAVRLVTSSAALILHVKVCLNVFCSSWDCVTLCKCYIKWEDTSSD